MEGQKSVAVVLVCEVEGWLCGFGLWGVIESVVGEEAWKRE